MKAAKLLLSAILIFLFSQNSLAEFGTSVSGNLSIGILSTKLFTSALPGDTVSYSIFYYYSGDGAAQNVIVTDTISQFLDVTNFYPQPTQVNGNIAVWNLGTLNGNTYGSIIITCIVKNSTPMGSTISTSAYIQGDVSEEDLSDNYSKSDIEVKVPSPEFWLIQWGAMENASNGLFLTAEKDVPVNIELTYINFSTVVSENTIITDSLQDGLEYVSANPAPSSVDGNLITWNVNNLEAFSTGVINLKVKPVVTGQMKLVAKISSSNSDQNSEYQKSEFSFTVQSILPPIVLKPSIKSYGSDETLIMGANPKLEGLARAGATVTIYEGDSIGYFGNLPVNNMNVIGSAVAGPDRKWNITPTTMSAQRKYYLYAQAEINGEKSSSSYWMWAPFSVEVNSMFDSAGFDFDNFVIQTGDQEVRPGALGGSSGTVPYQDIVIKKRFKAPPSILTDTTLWKNHEMKLVITEGGNTWEQTLPLTRVEQVTPNKVSASGGNDSPEGYWSYNFIYVQKGFGPGATVEVWCLPSYYNDEGLAIVGLVWVKCHEILIDPAGYVYDLDLAGSTYEWPAVPPDNSLIKNATVTAMVRTGDDTWERWKAEETGQVNPQVTDELTPDKVTVPGYFAFYVPSGQYRVEATAPGYADTQSPILTVIDEPVFYNVGMKKAADKTTGVKGENKIPNVPALFSLEQNYPNPFNPVTTIGYSLPVAAQVTLKIYDMLGKEVGTLIHDEFRSPGRHILQFNASSLASGVYFYRLSAGNFSATKKLVILK